MSSSPVCGDAKIREGRAQRPPGEGGQDRPQAARRGNLDGPVSDHQHNG
ncbi:MAG TPA: hypothetical protein VLL25_17255 [Acidimicrobiales bacterium]|nr:hypothetical protein [Acidimicrobiales bacterium]